MPSFGPYGPLAAQWLRDQGIPVRELVPTPTTLELGRKECTSKEYYSFASLLGVSLAAVGEGGDGEAAADGCTAVRSEGPAQACGEGAGAVDGPHAERDVAAAAVADAEGGWRVGQLLLPSSQGGEADGQFDRVIRSVLDAKGHGDVRVVAPDVELLPCNVADLEGLFVHVLAGDVVWAVAPAARPALQETFAKPHLTLKDVLTAASAAQESWQDVPVAPRKTLALVGEWPLVVGDELTGGLFARLEGEGYRAMRAPFAEYLLFVWEDGCDEARHGKVVGGLMPMLGETGAPRVVGLPDVPASQPESDRDQTLTLSDVQALAVGCEAACAHALGGCDGSHEHAAAQPQLATEPLEVSAAVEADPLFGAEQRTLPQDQWHAVLERLVGMMQQVADALGDMSAYASDYSQLRQIATDALGQFAGANARYRYAKAVQAGQRADGVVAVASMYENVDIMLRLKSVPCQAPLLHLAFDGALDQSVEERLRSFLYYV